MANPTLGKAYIEVHADTKPFGRELGVEVEAIAKAAEPQARGAGEKLGRSVSRGAKAGLKKESRSIWQAIKDIFERNSKKDRNFFRNVGASIGETIATGAAQGGKGIASLFTSIGSSIGNVGANGPFAGIIGVVIALGIPALIGLVASLIQQLGALINVIGLLPGALSILAAAIIPVVVAFQGFGEAISAIMSGDPQKIAEALKNLTPAARGVAREFQRVLPLWKALQDIAQENFFRQVTGAFENFSRKVVPTLAAGFGKVATVMGSLLKQFLDMASSPAVVSFLKTLFDVTAQAMSILGPAVIHLLGALAEVSKSSLPTLLKLITGFAGIINDFANFLANSVKDGSFKEFLDKFIEALGKLGDLAKSGWHLIEALIGDTNERSDAYFLFLLIIQLIDDLTDFFKSDTGKKGIQGMVTAAGAFLIVLVAIIKGVTVLLAGFQAVADTIAEIIRGIEKITGNDDTRHLNKKVAASVNNFRGHSEGTISTREHLAMISEGNKAEAVIPLTDPHRARQLAEQSGLLQMLSQSDTQVIVYIGDEQVMARVERRVKKGLDQFSRNMKYGPRPVGA